MATRNAGAVICHESAGDAVRSGAGAATVDGRVAGSRRLRGEQSRREKPRDSPSLAMARPAPGRRCGATAATRRPG